MKNNTDAAKRNKRTGCTDMKAITDNAVQRSKQLLTLLLCAGLLLVSVPVHAGKITRYVHTDHLGSPVAKTDSTGAVIWRQSYTPYGEDYQQADPDGPGFTGHRNDVASGLVYMQARYYDPEIGRFLSVDPVTFSQVRLDHFNRYWYANGNPYRFTDPDGRCPNCVAGGIGAGVGLLVGLGMEGYRQYKAGEFNVTSLAVEGGKGAIVGGLIGLTGGAAAASGMSLSAQAVTTGAVSLGVGSGAHAVGEVAKGNPAPSAGESLAVGAATAAGAVVGTAISPITSKLTTTVTPAVASHPVTSLSGKTFNTVNIPAQTVTRPAAAEALNSAVGSIVEEKVKPM